jgi:prephenate dehydrogenase
MQEFLPAGRAYIGLAPVINPFYLDERETGVDAARADLFKKGVTMIAAPASASEESVQLAADLVLLFGSSPLFADIVEIDGVMASAYLLPQLVSAALLNATVDAPGWGEMRKVAGREYANTTEASPIQEGTDSLSALALLNEQNVTRVLGEMITSLQNIKKTIADGDEDALNELLSRAEKGRENWLLERMSAKWLLRVEKTDSVSLGGIAQRLFGFKERK